ncbi:MAG: CAP domain-containing protein [Bacteroidia bacterium]|nr:CAP domain-containing protein [Bacteroidia bacterium]
MNGCKCGNTQFLAVSPITWDDLLTQAATIHAEDMNNNQFFDHEGSDGSNGGDRIKRVNYNWSAWGENIARDYPDEETVVETWIHSEPHCKNIMNSKFKDMGVAKSGNNWTQVFGAKK